MAVECVVAAEATLGEGPVWDAAAQCLWWVDIFGCKVHRFDPATGEDRVIETPSTVGAVAVRQGGGLVAALRDGFYLFDPESGEARVIDRPEPDKPDNRFNDGKCDRRGRFWAGTMHMSEQQPTGDLYRLDGDGRVTRFAAGALVTNGMAWSPDNTVMYFADSARRTIYRYAYDIETGDLAEREVFVTVPEDAGYPDGATVDADGCLWGTHWEGWRVTRYDPDGRIDRVIELPVPKVTSCSFGGPDLNVLYLTSARHGLDAAALAAAPLSGGVFAVTVDGVTGLPETRYAG